MDGDTGNLFHAYIDNYGNANGREHLFRNKFKEQEEKRHNDLSCVEKEDKNESNTDIIYLSPKFQHSSDVKLPEKKARVQKKHIRKSYIDFKSLKNKISAYSVISKCKIVKKNPAPNRTSASNIQAFSSGYLCNKTNNEVKVLYERGATKRRRKNNFQIKDSQTRGAKKSQSSDLFGFQRCIQRKRNVHYNLNVIYKFLRKDGKLKDHNVLRCKHYSFEDINKKKCKKMSSVVKFESDIPTHYNLVDFTQCSSVSNIYLLKPKDVKEEPKKKDKKVTSVMKVNNRRGILNKSDSHDSVNTQTLKTKHKQKKISTCACPTSKLFSWRTTAVNICQPSRWLCRHLTQPLGLESTVSKEHKESNNVSSDFWNVFKATLKYFLCAIAVIIWLPCILVIGLLWLISYPLRPHHDSKYTENIRKKNIRNNTKLTKILCKCKKYKQKSKSITNKQKNKRKRKGKDLTSANKLEKKSSKLGRKKTSRNSKKKYNKIHGKLSKKSVGDSKKSLKKIKKGSEKHKKASKSSTGFRLSGRTTKVTAFPSAVSRRSIAKKKQKNVTFKQPIEKGCEKTMYKKTQKKQCLCSEPMPKSTIKGQKPEDVKNKTLQSKELKRKEKKTRSHKIDPSKCQELMLKKPQPATSKRRKLKVCVPKSLSKLLQSALRHTCSTTNEIANFHKVSKVKSCYKTGVVPECVELMKSQSLESSKKKKNRRKKCKSYCCRKGCSGSSLPKSSNQKEFSPKSSVIGKETPKKNAKIATKKSNSVVKFFPSPKRQIQQPAPVVKHFPPSNQRTNSGIQLAKEDPKKISVVGDKKSNRQTPTEMKSQAQTKDKKVTKKGSKVRSTTVVKFFPPPSSPKDQCDTNRTEGSLQKSSSKSKGLTVSQLPIHTTSTNTDPVKPTTPRKFFSTPRKNTQTASGNTSIPKAASDNINQKSFRRNISSKGSVTNPRTPTSVIKFFPTPCPHKCSASSNTGTQKTSESCTESPKTTTVVKFRPPPQQPQITTAINTTESKSSPLKNFLSGFRCTKRSTRSIGSDARLEKRTSVFKFLPPPRHVTRTLAINAVKTPSVLSNASTQSCPADKKIGDKFQRKPISNKTYQNTSSSNMDPNKASNKTSFSPAPSPSSKKRSRGVTTNRPSQVVKFFPKQQYNTRSLSVTARPPDKSNERTRTANKPISTPKGNISVIKFYPHPHVVTQTTGTNTLLKKIDKKCDASRLTNIIKFFPSPKKATINRGTVPHIFKEQSIKNLQKRPLTPKFNDPTNSPGNNDDQPGLMRGFRKLAERQIIRKLGQPPPQASNVSKKSSDAKTLAGGKIKQKSKQIQSHCQPDCKGVQVNRKNFFSTNSKIYQVQKKSDRPGGTTASKTVGKNPQNAPKSKVETTVRKDKQQNNTLASKYSKLVPGMSKPVESEKRPQGKIKKFFASIYKDEEIDCTELMMKSSERPCRWIYERWPSAYPAFMVLYKIYNNMIHIFFFFFAACIWCPLFCWCFIFYFFVVKRLFC